MRSILRAGLALGTSMYLTSCLPSAAEELPDTFDLRIEEARYYRDSETFYLGGVSVKSSRQISFEAEGSKADCYRDNMFVAGSEISMRFADSSRQYVLVESVDGLAFSCEDWLKVQ
tara:strand:- start:3310 stop:3657 length:348 start_codon:yes stop_codon:yes gene_type:complete